MFEQGFIQLSTKSRTSVIDVTDEIATYLNKSGLKSGIINIYIPHTTACVTINENDTSFWRDLLDTFQLIAPDRKTYHHQPNSNAHILSSMINPSVSIPFSKGGLMLGTYQRILFLELDGPRGRKIIITLVGTD
jgi:secondary thiamine-phosphate synthase enzyme